MARIARFEKITSDRQRIHGTETNCGYGAFDVQGRRYLQLETYGSNERKIPGKISQTLQLDEDRAAELLRIIRQTFPRI
jgi:hypothetical protein